jgi:hypothetical protein
MICIYHMYVSELYIEFYIYDHNYCIL